jgi:hypothetical protein
MASASLKPLQERSAIETLNSSKFTSQESASAIGSNILDEHVSDLLTMYDTALQKLTS